GDVFPGAPSPLLPLFESWLCASRKGECQIDGNTMRLLNSRLNPECSTAVMSLAHLGDKFGTERHEIKNRMMDAASIAILSNRAERRALELALTSSDVPGDPVQIQPMHYAEFLMYDESPHTLKFVDFIRGGGRHRMLESIALPLPDAVQGDALVGQLPSQLAAMSASEVGPMKLLQIRTEFSMLLRVIDHRRGGAVSWCMLSGEQPNHLQAIDRCTAENCRRMFKTVVRPLIEPVFGECPADAALYRMRCIRLFTTSLQNSVPKLVARHMFPNGDWRRRDIIPIYLAGEEADYTPAQIDSHKTLVVEGLCYAFCSRAPDNFAEHHWTGHTECTCAFGMLEVCNGILAHVYPAWARSKGTRPRRPVAAAGEVAAAAAPVPGGGAAVVPFVAPEVGPAARDGGRNPIDAAEEQNSADRRIACDWILSDPLFDLLLMRMALTVLAPLDHVGLTMSGEAWEREQRHKVAAALSAGQSMAAAMAGRQYRISVAAEGAAEMSAFRKLRYLYDEDEFWTIVPIKYFDDANVTKVFRLFSRLGALIEELWAAPNRSKDVQLFRLVHDPSRLAQVRAGRVRDYCLYGAFGRKFLEDILDCGDQSEIIVRLAFLASCIRTSMAPVEAGWAFVRRLCKKLGCQTHQQELGYISAQWVLSRFRAMLEHDHTLAEKFVLPENLRIQCDAADDPGEDGDASPSAAGWSGPWRAFVAESDIGLFRDFGSLGERYRDVKANDPVRFAQLQAAGAQGAERRRAGERPFGPIRRDVVRAAHREQQQARCQRISDMISNPMGGGMGDDDEVDQKTSLAEAIVEGGATLDTSLQSARADAKWFGKLKAAEHRQLTSDLLDYSSRNSRDLVQNVFGTSPLMAPLLHQLGAVPVPMERFSHLTFQSAAAVRTTCVTALVAVGRCPSGRTARPLLGADWGRKHTMQMHAAAEPIRKETVAERNQWRCARAGVHLCGAKGKDTYSFRNSVLRMLKVRCPKDSAARQKLIAGSLVLCVARMRREPDDHNVPLDFEAAEVVCSWYHLAVHYLSPFRPTLQTMLRQDWDGPVVNLKDAGVQYCYQCGF
ncbi:unnamed protein product, partial [Prorocentrum cordatum]